MSSPHNTLTELQELSLSRPAADAPAPIVADWYRRKAAVLDHLASEGTPSAAEHALLARKHARTLAAPEVAEIGTAVRESRPVVLGVAA